MGMTEEVKNILVTGGAGCIGSILVRELLNRGYHVKLLDVLLYEDSAIAQLYNRPGFQLIRGDFRCPDQVVHAIKDTDTVIHLGAIVGDQACTIDEQLTVQINLDATRTIARLAKDHGVKRFLFSSTYSIYGANQEIVDEQSELNPLSLYAQTKIEAERALLAMTDATFAPVILRLATVYGLSYRPRFDLVVNLLAANAVVDGQIIIIEGDQWRSFVHVRDVAQAFLLALEVPLHKVKGQIFNVGSNHNNYRLRQLGDLVKEVVPDVTITHQNKIEDRRNCQVRFDKISHELGFQPQWTLLDGILEIKQALETGLVKDHHDPRYHNYRFLTESGRLNNLITIAPVSLR